MLFEIVPGKTYATKENAIKVVKDKGFEELRFFIMKTDKDRFFPVFVGMAAIEAGVHFHFNVIG